MTGPSRRDAVIDGILAGLPTGYVDAARAAAIRRRMLDRLERSARRRASVARSSLRLRP